MWKTGLEAGKNGTGGGDDERRSNRTPRPSEERALIETTGMSWVEQAALRGAMAKEIVRVRQRQVRVRSGSKTPVEDRRAEPAESIRGARRSHWCRRRRAWLTRSWQKAETTQRW